MNMIGIAVHGGAGPDSAFSRENEEGYKQGIKAALSAGYEALEQGMSAVDAVEAAIKSLENNLLFNAGKGSAIKEGEGIEMCSSIMEGKEMKCGAIAIVKAVKNPVRLARAIMEQSSHIYLGQLGGEKFANEIGLEQRPEAYFKTEHAIKDYEEKQTELRHKHQQHNPERHGTVGAVALDKNGDIAAATSTGGTEAAQTGRIGDSSMIGAGTYANNETCAVSCTGDGEYNIRFVSAFHVAALVEYKGFQLQQACDFLIHQKAKEAGGDMGLIAINTRGEVAMAFNSERMHRGWKTSNKEGEISIY